MTHLRQVLTLLEEKGLIFEVEKWKLFSDTIDYPGQAIHPGLIEIAERTSNAIRGLKYLKNITDFNSFLALCKVFGRLVPNFNDIEEPINYNLQKDQPRNFEPLSEVEKAVSTKFQERIISPPVIAFPRTEVKYTVDID